MICFEGENNYFGLRTLFFHVPSFLIGVWNKSRQKMRLQREWEAAFSHWNAYPALLGAFGLLDEPQIAIGVNTLQNWSALGAAWSWKSSFLMDLQVNRDHSNHWCAVDGCYPDNLIDKMILAIQIGNMTFGQYSTCNVAHDLLSRLAWIWNAIFQPSCHQ